MYSLKLALMIATTQPTTQNSPTQILLLWYNNRLEKKHTNKTTSFFQEDVVTASNLA
jgi:hypothetical protein